MDKIIKLHYLFLVIFLSGCSSMSDSEFMLAQGEDPREQTFNAHLKEWQKLKPEIYELVKMKKELTALINNLNDLADDTEKDLIANQEIIMPLPEKAIMPASPLSKPQFNSSIVTREVVEEKESTQKAAPLTLATKKFAIQLGSFSNMIYVKRIWKKVKAKFPQIMTNKTPRSESVAISNNRTLFRLKVGSYATKANAKEVCDLLIAEQQNCIATSLSGETFE